MSNNHHRECWWVFVFECLCSAEDMQGYNNMHHKRFKRKHTLTGRKKEGEEKARDITYYLEFQIMY